MPLKTTQTPAYQLGPDGTFDRRWPGGGAITMTSGVLRIGYLIATKTETITSVRLSSHTTPAAATPTLVRVGVWSVSETDESITLVASTANDTTLLAGASTLYAKALSSSFNKVAGQRYAVGLIVVTASTAPTVWGGTVGGALAETSATPRLSAVLTAQADLPTGVTTNASLTATVSVPQILLVP